MREAAYFLLNRCHALWPANNRYLRRSRHRLRALEVADTGWDRHPQRRNRVTSVTLACHPQRSREPVLLTAGSLGELAPSPRSPTPRSHVQKGQGLGRFGARSSLGSNGCAAPSREEEEGASTCCPCPHTPLGAGTPRSCAKRSLRANPAGGLAPARKPYNNKPGCESEAKNNSVRKQISGSGCQRVITLNNRHSVISTAMSDVLTVAF